MTQRLKILNIVGARPNLPKIAPLMHEMQRHPEIEAILVHTGQHYDEKFSKFSFARWAFLAARQSGSRLRLPRLADR